VREKPRLRNWATPRYQVAVLALLFACREKAPALELDVPADQVASRLLARVEPTSWSRPDEDPRIPGVCRIIVVTTHDCSVAKALMVGWAQDAASVIESSGTQATSAWIVFGEADDARQLLSRHVVQVPSVWRHPGTLQDMESILRLNGTPQTLVINKYGELRAHFSGNVIVPTRDLQLACQEELQ